MIWETAVVYNLFVGTATWYVVNNLVKQKKTVQMIFSTQHPMLWSPMHIKGARLHLFSYAVYIPLQTQFCVSVRYTIEFVSSAEFCHLNKYSISHAAHNLFASTLYDFI